MLHIGPLGQRILVAKNGNLDCLLQCPKIVKDLLDFNMCMFLLPHEPHGAKSSLFFLLFCLTLPEVLPQPV